MIYEYCQQSCKKCVRKGKVKHRARVICCEPGCPGPQRDCRGGCAGSNGLLAQVLAASRTPGALGGAGHSQLRFPTQPRGQGTTCRKGHRGNF